MTEKPDISWNQLLNEALTKPGAVAKAYSAFHNYSSGNQLLALFQCYMRHIEPGPIATYPAWHAKGRQVRKGSKAISLWMPITSKRTATSQDDAGNETEESIPYTRFILRNNWFVLSQTDGQDFQADPIPNWDESAALAVLAISKVPFDGTNGNVQGFALPGRKVAVSPLAELPSKTLFHELAHVMLGHTEESPLTDDSQTPRSLREVEAESVALIVCESLGLAGAEYCRGYIQNWAAGLSAIPERSAQRIFKAADQIIKAGLPAKTAGAA